MVFSKVLKLLREERNLSQKEIAEYLGITRQAVASYELGKREPDYRILNMLADYFGVSVDYLLGRSGSREIDAYVVGRNIELIRGVKTYQELSEDIMETVGAHIFPEMLELYSKGERMPFAGTIRILAKYAGVDETFFYNNNTFETLEKEREVLKSENCSGSFNDKNRISEFYKTVDTDLVSWMMKDNNIEYVRLAKEIQEAGLTAGVLAPLINSFKYNKSVE